MAKKEKDCIESKQRKKQKDTEGQLSKKMMECQEGQTERDTGDESFGLMSRFSSCGSLGEKDLGNF